MMTLDPILDREVRLSRDEREAAKAAARLRRADPERAARWDRIADLLRRERLELVREAELAGAA